MSATLIIALIVFIIAAVIILKVVKKIVKAILMIAGLALVLILIAGFIIAADIKDLKDEFEGYKKKSEKEISDLEQEIFNLKSKISKIDESIFTGNRWV